MRGMRRTVTHRVQILGEECEFGRSPMSFPMYRAIYGVMIKSKKPEHIFARCFMTNEWSLISRFDNICESHTDHLR